MQGKGIKYFLFVLLVGLLWFPLLQEQFLWFKEPVLKGAFVKPYQPTWNIDSVKDLSYQQQFEKYRNSNFGFRSFLIKFKNTTNYKIFSELSITDNLAGKNDFIFSLGSVQRTLGISYNGKEKNLATISKIKFLQEGIENGGGHFLVVIPPSKESVFPELLPSQYNIKPKENTDYNDFVSIYKQLNIPFLDFVNYFNLIKTSSQYPLFTNSGFHWSVYGASVAHDTLVHYMQKAIGKDFPGYKRIGVEVSDTARDPDADFEGPLNLFFSLGKPPYYYPKFEMIKSEEKNFRPKVIIVGDSYFWQLKHQRLMDKIFTEDSKFWYYFATNSFPIGDVAGVPLNSINIMNELRTADYVLLVGNISTMDAFPYGLAEYYYNNVATPEIHGAIAEQVRYIPELKPKPGPIGVSEEGLIGNEARRICRDALRTGILASNGKFITAGGAEEKILVANRDVASDWEIFTVYKMENNRVAISSYKNNFLSAELGRKGEITSSREKIGGWEKFEMTKLEGGHVAFKADNGKYLSLDRKSGQIFASANSVGENEKFIFKSTSKK